MVHNSAFFVFKNFNLSTIQNGGNLALLLDDVKNPQHCRNLNVY